MFAWFCFEEGYKMKEPTLFERYLDWAVKPGAPRWREPFLVIGTSIFLSCVVPSVFVWLPLWYFVLRSTI